MSSKTDESAFSIRPFSPEDAAEILRWIRSEYEMRLWSGWTFPAYPLAPESLIKLYAEQHPTHYLPLSVCDAEGRLIGHILLRSLAGEAGAFRLAHFIIRPDLRGRGLGKKIMREVLRLAAEQYGAKHFLLAVYAHNLPAFLTYCSLGFVRTVEVNQYYRVGDEIWEVVEMERYGKSSD